MLAPIHNGVGEAAARQAGAQALMHSQSSASLNANTQSELTLVTAEGDRVTLSAQAQMAYRYGQFDLNMVSNRGAISMSGSSMDYMQMSGFEIQVQGELNEQELADIQELLGAFKQSISEFLDGDLEAAIAAARSTPDSLSGLQTIAAFDYSFTLNASAQVSRSQSLSLNLPQPETQPADAAPLARNARRVPAAAAERPAQVENDAPRSPAQNYRITPESVDSLAERLAAQVEALRMDNQRYQELIPQVLEYAIGELRSESENEGRTAALDSISDQLLGRFKEPASDNSYRADRAAAPPGDNRNFSARA